MGVVASRLVFLAFLGLTGSIIYNALYLQDGHGTAAVSPAPPPRQVTTTTIEPPAVEATTPPPVSTDLPPLQVEEGAPQLLVRAIQRELSARGYDVGPIDGRLSGKTRAAISAYQSREGMTVTGAASDELLRHILLGDSVKPAATGSVGAVSSAGAKTQEDGTVKAVQQILADLGYAPGPVDGAFGPSTGSAISAFQRDRKIRDTGRITSELLRELKRVTGRDLTKTAAHP